MRTGHKYNMARHTIDTDLTPRQKEILRFIIQEHISTNAPIGSRNISRFAKYSPATIRNEMADLEYMGYLVQPHTSAGRLPSVEGYKYYLSELFDLDEAQGGIAEEERKIIETVQNSPVDKLMGQASKALYDITKSVAIVTSPIPANLLIKDIRFVQANPHITILLVVTNSGGVHNVTLDTSYLIDHAIDFEYLNNIMAHYMRNTSINDLQKNIDKVLKQVKQTYDGIVGIERLFKGILEGMISYTPGISVAGEKSLLHAETGVSGEKLYDIIRDYTSCWEFIRQLPENEGKIEVDNMNVILGDNDTFLNKYAIIQVNYGNSSIGKGSVVLIGMQHMSYMRNILTLNRLIDSLTSAMQNK